MDENSPRSYYTVIPADVRYDSSLSANAKLLYGEISALIGEDKYCFASNAYLAEPYGITERTVSDSISKLRDAGYIKLVFDRDPKTGEIKRRRIYLCLYSREEHPVEENFYTPRRNLREGIEKNFQYTNLRENIYIGNSCEDSTCSPPLKESTPETGKDKKKSKKAAFDPEPLIAEFALAYADESLVGDLLEALHRFVENRDVIKKPIKSKAAMTGVFNRLVKFSEENVPCMIDLLDLATQCNWQTVYPPKQSDGAQVKQSNSRRETEWL